jgi:hypothetical protein
MGATVFIERIRANSVNSAFASAREQARDEIDDDDGYTGTILEKDSFIMIPLPNGADADMYIRELIENNDSRIDDKWGAAGCIQLSENEYVFFGWASC